MMVASVISPVLKCRDSCGHPKNRIHLWFADLFSHVLLSRKGVKSLNDYELQNDYVYLGASCVEGHKSSEVEPFI